MSNNDTTKLVELTNLAESKSVGDALSATTPILPAIGGNAFGLLAVMIDRLWDGESPLSNGELQDATGLTRRTLVKHVGQLEDEGLLTVKRTDGCVNVYGLPWQFLYGSSNGFDKDNQCIDKNNLTHVKITHPPIADVSKEGSHDPGKNYSPHTSYIPINININMHENTDTPAPTHVHVHEGAVSVSNEQMWSEIKFNLQGSLMDATYNKLLRTSFLIDRQAGRFVIGVDSEHIADVLQGRYQQVVRRAIRDATGSEPAELQFVTVNS